jgi:hypothetical protein
VEIACNYDSKHTMVHYRDLKLAKYIKNVEYDE